MLDFNVSRHNLKAKSDAKEKREIKAPYIVTRKSGLFTRSATNYQILDFMTDYAGIPLICTQTRSSKTISSDTSNEIKCHARHAGSGLHAT